MKYMQDGGFQSNSLMRLTLGLTLALLLGFWVTNLSMYFSRMNLRPSSVVSYYNGSEADFRPPRSLESMTETTHMHLPMMALVLLFLTHLTIFVPMPRNAKLAFIVGAFTSAAFEEGGGWLVRFVSPGLAIVKVVGFVGLQSALAILMLALARFLFRGRRSEPGALREGRESA